MADLIAISCLFALLLTSLLYVRGCDRLKGSRR
jgi:hypothetical protein